MYIKRFSKFNPAVAIVRGTKHVHTFNVKWLRPKPKTCFLDFSYAKHFFSTDQADLLSFAKAQPFTVNIRFGYKVE